MKKSILRFLLVFVAIFAIGTISVKGDGSGGGRPKEDALSIPMPPISDILIS